MKLDRSLPPVAILGLLLALAACADGMPSEAETPAPGEQAPLLAALDCTVDAAAETLSCAPATPRTGASPTLIVGGQGTYVTLASTNVTNTGTQVTADVTVTNHLGQPLATDDGSTPDANGVRVFFHSGPTNGVTVANADGIGTFTASGQPYHQHSSLGGDGILTTDEASAAEAWAFDLNGATSFSFTVFVHAEVPDEAALSELHAAIDPTTITAGTNHSCGLDTTGKAWCWGRSHEGELGNGVSGTNANFATPDSVHGGHRWSSIDAGLNFTCGVTDAGAGYCWGQGSSGKLGRGTGSTANANTPQAVAGAITWETISAGGSHACGLATDGSVVCWGSDAFGQLGDGTNGSPPSRDTPAAVTGGRTWETVSAGDSHTCAISAGGAAYCWGDDFDGQLGNGSSTGIGRSTPQLVQGNHSWIDVVGGLFHSCGVTSENRAFCWGDNSSGQATGSASGDLLTPQEVASGTAWASAAAGDGHSCAVDTSGGARCWGSDGSGQRGDGTADDGVVAGGHTWAQLSAGGAYTCGVTTGGAAYCWGSDNTGKLGDGTTGGSSASPTAVVDPASGAVTWRAP